MAKSKFDTSFNFGASVTKKARKGGGKKKRRKMTAAQLEAARYYGKTKR
jgi:hypothetical protein